MTLRLHVDPPEGTSYILPPTTDVDQLRADLERLAEKRIVAVEFQMADDPRGTGTLYINAETVISLVLYDLPDELDVVKAPDDLSDS